MGWADCGADSEGRPIGYGFAGKCDHDGCDADIDRGLSYACGGMHGAGEGYCEKYFCGEHLTLVDRTVVNALGYDLHQGQLCPDCLAKMIQDVGKRVLAGDIAPAENLQAGDDVDPDGELMVVKKAVLEDQIDDLVGGRAGMTVDDFVAALTGKTKKRASV